MISAEDTSKSPTKRQVKNGMPISIKSSMLPFIKSGMLISIRARIRRRAKRHILSLSFGPKCCGNSYKMRGSYRLKRGA